MAQEKLKMDKLKKASLFFYRGVGGALTTSGKTRVFSPSIKAIKPYVKKSVTSHVTKLATSINDQ